MNTRQVYRKHFIAHW